MLSPLLLLLVAVAPAFAIGVGVSGVSVRQQGDSLLVELRLDLTVVEVSPSMAYTFTPVLRSGTRVEELPPVVVTGKRRGRFDRRRDALATGEASRPAYRVLTGNGKRRDNLVAYSVRVAYVPWMAHARLSLMQESRECCDWEILTVDDLLADLGLPECPPAEGLAPATADVAPPASGSPASPVSGEDNGLYSKSLTLYIDYPLNSYEVLTFYKGNAAELARLDSLFRPLRDGTPAAIRRVSVCGYASPEGPYLHNEALASNRARLFLHYLTATYSLDGVPTAVSWVAEDWVGLVELLGKRRPPYYEECLALIRRYGVFEGREKKLMELRGGEPYRRMCAEEFPLLRRLDVTVVYDTAGGHPATNRPDR